MWDGIFYSATYVFIVLGLYLFWRVAHTRHRYWSSRMMVGAVLIGWASFNVVEGLVDHQLPGVHRVNELVPKAQ